MDSKRPALIIDGGSRGDIGVIRSLGLGSVPVQLLATDPSSPSVASRYVTHVHPFPGLAAPDEACLTAIRTAVRKIEQRPVMFATGDRALAFMSRQRAELAEMVDHDLAPADTIETCLNKDRFVPAAQQLNCPVPETFVPASVAEARMLVGYLSYPVFVKPVNRADWSRLPPGTVESVKGQRVDSDTALLHLLGALEVQDDSSRFVIQRFVEGGDEEHVSVHAYVLSDGTIAGTFTGSKLRIYPTQAGVGTYVMSRPIPELEALSQQVLKALGYTGFADLQFKRDVRCGVYHLLEINCRYSIWTELPSRAGCNFPLTAYVALVGQSLPELKQREGIVWLDLERDLLGMKTYRTSGEWALGGYLKSLVTARCWAYFAWDDPGPFCQRIKNRFRAAMTSYRGREVQIVG